MMYKKFTTLLLASMIIIVSFGQESREPDMVIKAEFFDKSPALRDMTPVLTGPKDRSWKDGVVDNKSIKEEFKQRTANSPANGPDAALQTVYPENGIRGPEIGIEGIGNVNGVFPPDTDGDVGPDHYFQMINLSFAIWDKQGNKLYGPVNNSTLWDGFVGPWTGTNDGDPIVLYDEEADRWLATQFAVNTGNGVNYQLLAVSATSDPLGEYYRYAFAMVAFNDYPKFGIWNDAYYATWNMFGSYTRAAVGAYERDLMLVGDPNARMVFYNQSASKFAMMPADFDGTPPPDGTPCYFMHINTWTNNQIEIYEFDVDWNNTANSSFGLVASLTPATFNSNLNGIQQPGTATRLDDLTQMIMYRLQYRYFDTHESMVVNHTVGVSGRGAPRWYEFRKVGSGQWSIYQQGTYAPDSENRWMGSIAMNGNGDIALGYSVSSGTTYPSIRYTGRRASDPLGQMTVQEVELKTGTGSQGGIDRWGDYSCMSVDPADDSTFWFTTEYMKSGAWGTYIGKFNLGLILPPTANAGTDATICTNDQFTTEASVTRTQSVLWETTGDGIFPNPNNLVATYIRGSGDVANGYVDLVLNAYGFEPGLEDTDSVRVFIVEGPTAFAGNDTLLCDGEVLQLSGMATSYDIVEWSTSGDGTFSDMNALDAIYTPGSSDIINGSVDLTLFVEATEGCVGTDDDVMTVTIDECTGINENDLNLSLGVRPNPNSGIFSYDVVSRTSSDIVVEVLNLQGQLMFTQKMSGINGNYTGTINIGNNPRGIYYLRINNGQDIRVEKVLVQ